MNTKTRLALACMAMLAFIVFNSSSGGRNSINTNGCASCHTGGGGSGGSITLTPESDCVAVNQTISMTLCIADGNAVVGGFTMNASAGSLIPGTGSRNGTSDAWLTQSTPRSFTNGESCWTFDYTAPSTEQIVDFNLYGNAANGNGSNGSGDDPYIGSASIEVKTTLPISMSSFELKNDRNKKVIINWETESETNNEYFTIERSLDGRSFEALIDLEGQGNSTTTQSYSFIDEKPVLNQTMYYRIQQVDFDGRTAFSDIQSIELSMLEVQLQKMFPVPLSLGQPLNVIFSMPFDNDIEIDILSSDGKLVQQFKNSGVSGTNEVALNLDRIQETGLYYLVIGNDMMKIEAKAFVIK